jgi:hypothetical protein
VSQFENHSFYMWLSIVIFVDISDMFGANSIILLCNEYVKNVKFTVFLS